MVRVGFLKEVKYCSEKLLSLVLSHPQPGVSRYQDKQKERKEAKTKKSGYYE